MGNSAWQCEEYSYPTRNSDAFSENPDVYVKKQVQIRTQRPQITLKHICLFLSFFQTENLLHSVILKWKSVEIQIW